jgi:ADP-ribose pyrophosphatase YjhB (NUDIX family)
MPPTLSREAAWEDYPRPSLAVDVVVLTVEPGPAGPRLGLLVIRRTTSAHRGRWDIPGAFVQHRERLDVAVARVLREKAGVGGLVPRHLGVFDEPDRDERGWVVSVASSVAVPYGRLQPVLGRDVRLAAVERSGSSSGDAVPAVSLGLPNGQRRLPFDHDEIVRRALADLRGRYRKAPDPDRLLESDEFTLSELSALHSVVDPDDEHRDTFRRRVEPHLAEIGIRRLAVGRPAKVYTRIAPAGGGSPDAVR